MKYIQLIDANMNTGYQGGWCLKFVQDAFETDHPYASATDAWYANYGGGNHPGELPPSGKTVPIYFSLGTEPDGHVAISLDDGTVASSTLSGYHSSPFIHASMQDMINTYAKYNGNCEYLGWSEYVGTVKVIKKEDEMSREVTADETTVRLEYNNALGRNASAEEVQSWVGSGATVETLQRGIQGSPEHYQFLLDQQLGVKARTENWEQKIKDSESEFIKVSDLYIKK